MTGGTYAHDAISLDLSAALVPRLRGKACRPHGSNLKIKAMGSIRYPDMPEIGIKVPLAEFYGGLDLSERPADEEE